MATTELSDRFTALPDEQTLAERVTALEENGFSVDAIDDIAFVVRRANVAPAHR